MPAMGLPRLYGDETSEEAAMLPNGSLGASPQFSRISSPTYDGLPESQSVPLDNLKIIGCVWANARGMSSAVNGDLEKKNVFEFPKCLHTNTPRLDLDISSNINARRNGVDEKQSSLKLTQRISNPASRVVGFKSPIHLSPTNVQTVMPEGFQNHSPFYTYEDNSDLPSQKIRKRTLSPLNGMFPSGHVGILGGYIENERKDLLVFSGSDANEIKGEQYNSDRHDFKKANFADSSPSMPLPILRSHKWEYHPTVDCNCSIITTDGPLLDGVKILTPNCYFLGDLYQQSHNGLKKKIAGRAVGSKCSKFPPLLSLSPLGPRWHDRMRLNYHAMPENDEAADANSPPSRNLSIIHEECQTDNTSVLEDEIVIARKSFQEFGIFYKDLSPLPPHEYAGDETQCRHESTLAPWTGIKIHRSFSGLPTRRSLVGSFEESLLSGRFSSGKANQKIDGFLAVLSVSGGSFSPASRKLPFSVTCVDGNSSLLYYATVDLAGNLYQHKSRGSRSKKNGNYEDSRAARSRYRIPVKGRIQLVLSNPEMTPVHTFACNYDLSDMPPGTKTFMRHKVSLASSGLTSIPHKEILARSRDMAAKSMAASSAIVHGRSLQSNDRLIDVQSEEKVCSLRFGNLSRLLKDKASEDRSCTYSENSVNNDIYKGAVVSVKVNSTALAPNNILDRNAITNFTVDDKKVPDSLKLHEDQVFHKEDDSLMDICDKSGKKAVHNSAKVNENTLSGGVLRYALHLFFLCPPLKKGSNSPLKCNSDSLLPSAVSDNSMQVEDERRFYLYNDLRVVFPQRHSDTDEGKFRVECHFPANPKYFEYSN